MDKTIKDLTPSMFKDLIKKGLMTKEEAGQAVMEWKVRNQIYETTGETIKDMGLEEELEDNLEEQDAKGMDEWERSREDMMEDLSRAEDSDPSEDYKNN